MRTAIQLKTSLQPARPPITVATPAEIDRCSALLTLAFADDPAGRWIWPDPHQYLEAFARFVRAFGGKAFERDAAHRLDDYSGVALWLPPGDLPDDEALSVLIRDSVEPHLQDAVLELFEQMGQYHPEEPYWHLPLIGVDPTQQCNGYGSALLSRMLARCDREQLPAYLEATGPRNVPLYRRHGFVPLGEIQVGGSPPVTPMLRRPRPR